MDLNILKDKNSHPRDSRIKFDSENHIYSVDDKNNYNSVTQLISNFFPRFDKDYWANKESIKTGMPKKEIIKGWDEKGRKARESGTHMHLQIEKYYNNIEYKKNIEILKFLEFEKKYIKDKHQPYRTEWKIFDEDSFLAGTVDMVYKKKEGELFIFDWKRSKNIINKDGTIDNKNPFENGKKGLSHLSSTDYNKYTLQQNIYKYILEKNYDKKISSMNLLILHPNYLTFHIVQVPEMKDETEYLIEKSKKNITL